MGEVNPGQLESAAKLVDDAAAHFKKCSDAMYDILIDLPKGPLLGGWGETGGFQEGLGRFNWKFKDVLDDFLFDETAFWLFLQGFGDRLRQSAGTYRKTELTNTDSFKGISRVLDSGEA